MNINFKKLQPQAQAPLSSLGNAGADLYAISKTFREGFIEYGTGLAFEIPEGYVGLLFPRSSISNKDLTLANSVGVIDSSYRGEVKMRFVDSGPIHYEEGERIGQLVILPCPAVEFNETEELSVTDRGEGGFGSTGS